jgi:aquaporin Z
MELAEMAAYLSCTCVFTTLLQHPASPLPHLIPSIILRRATFGILIGTTLTAIILTPWGSNPAVISIRQ